MVMLSPPPGLEVGTLTGTGGAKGVSATPKFVSESSNVFILTELDPPPNREVGAPTETGGKGGSATSEFARTGYGA